MTSIEQRLADEIMKAVRQLSLPLKLDALTEAKGDCFPLAILAQCQRPEIYNALASRIQEVIKQNDPTILRKAVKRFMLSSSHSKILEYETNYKEVLTFDYYPSTWKS